MLKYREVKFWLILFIVFLSIENNYGQYVKLSGIVRDKQSDEQIPFASVKFKKSGKGMLTDSAGKFTFLLNTATINDTLEVFSVGYKVLPISVGRITDSLFLTCTIEVLPPVYEAVVKSKYNRALWFWKKIMSNKFRNDKKSWDNYGYEIYNKLEMDLNNVNKEKLSRNGIIKPLKFVFNYIDSNSESKPFLPIYISETLSDYYFQKEPERIYEKIKATKTNGVENESFIKELGGTFQNVNVMNNFIPVFNREFISPFNVNADFYYKFKLADTAYLNGKRLVHLFFTGKRKGESTFDGDCWVNDTLFALQRITLRPSADVNINFIEGLTLLQEFKLINDTTWFLYKDKFVADLAPVGNGKLGLKGRKTTTYTNVVLNQKNIAEQLLLNTKNIQVDLMPASTELSDSFWVRRRHEPLNKNELTVYKVLDTLNKNPTYLFYKDALEVLAKGTKDFGKIRLGPWFYWVSSNNYEGPRFRFDMATNKSFSKRWNFSGYLAYGVNDGLFKGKAKATYLLNKDLWSYISFTHKDDLDNRQLYYDQLGNDNIFATIFRRPNIPYKFQRMQETKLDYFKETGNGLSIELTAANRNYTALKNLPTENGFNTIGENPFGSFETSIKLRYAYQERYLEDNFLRRSLGSTKPIVEIKYTKAWASIFNNQNEYHKVDFSVSHLTSVAPYGTLYWNVFGGKIFGTVPYPFLNILPGNELYYYNKYAFNLMNQFEFIGNQYAGFNVEHNIGNGLFRYIPITRKLKFRQFWSVKGVVANLSDANKQLNFTGNYLYKSLNDKMYVELGTGIDNILKFFRIDLVWRVAPQPMPKETINQFGVFGSFRFSF